MKPSDLAGRLTWCLLAVLVASALLLHVHLISQLRQDGENTPDESDSLAGLSAAATGQPVYRDFRVAPHMVAAYMPAFYWVPATVARLTTTDMLRTFIIGRGFIYLTWLGISFLIYGLARQSGVSRRDAAVGMALWLAGSLATENAICFRPDAPALLLSLTGLWLYRRAVGLPGKLGAIAVLVLAFLFRHTAVAALAVIIAEELSARRFRWAGLLAAVWMAAVGGTIVIMQTLTHGTFAANVFGPVVAGAGWPQVELLLQLSVLRGSAAFLAAAFVLANPGRVRLISRYCLIALLIGFATSWKFGAGTNYYLEPFAGACILAACFLGTGSAWARASWLVVALVAAVPVLATRIHPQRPVTSTDELRACVGTAPGILLSEDGYLALRRDGTPFLLNASMLSAMQRNGGFDDRPVVRRIEAGEFALIVTTAPLESTTGFRHFPPHWIVAIRTRYALARVCGEGQRYVFLPKPSRELK